AARCDASLARVSHSSIRPVAMRIQNCRKRTVPFAEWPIQISCEIEAGVGSEINLLDAVAIAFDFPKNMGTQRRFLRQRPQSATDKDLFANFFGARLPCRPRLDFRKRARCVQILEGRGALIGSRQRLPRESAR